MFRFTRFLAVVAIAATTVSCGTHVGTGFVVGEKSGLVITL